MKLSRLLFKPKWQDPEAAVRAAAVAGNADAELIAALPELTRADPDARVRLAALRRLNDYERWRERSTADPDADVRRLARETYLALLCSDAPNRPPLARCVAELETLTPAELEHVASSAADRDLRRAALAYVTRPALLAQRATGDPDPALRLAALARIDDAATLERIAERARKTDKTVSRIARERLSALRIITGDAVAIEARARALCERLDALLRATPATIAGARATVEREWAGLGDGAPPALSARFAGALRLLDRLTEEPRAAQAATVADAGQPGPAQGTEAAASAEASVSGAMPEGCAPGAAATADAHAIDAESESAAAARVQEPQSPNAATYASRARFDAALAAAEERSRREREQRKAFLRELEETIAPYQERLEAGDTAGAITLHARLAELEKSAGHLPREVEHRLAPLHARFAELRRWQHWSNQRRRRTLCEELEKLPGAGLHPDAVATRVREARTEWQRLDAMEGLAGTAAEAAGLARRFHGLCQRALKPAAVYFEKRAELRDSHAQEIESLLAQAAATAPDAGDWKALAALRRDLAVALRALDEIEPRARHRLAKRLKDAIASLTLRIEAHAAGVESAKARLIEQANALAARPDRSAPRLARELQQQWTALGEGVRSVDQRQWREFRSACDRVFAGLDTERREREAQSTAQTEQARSVLAEGDALLADGSQTAAALVTARRGLEARWRAFASPDRALERKFRSVIEALEARGAEKARAGRLSRFEAALAHYARLRAVECGEQSADALAPADDGQGSIPLLATPLAPRCERARAGQRAALDDEAIEQARDILVELEFAGGVPSSAEDRERRMNYQVRRLSARMRGAGIVGSEEELAALLARWFTLPGPLPDALEARFSVASRAALALLP